MTDTATLTDAIAQLDPDQRALIEVERAIATPVYLAAKWSFHAITMSDGQPGILAMIQNQAAGLKLVMTRDDALDFMNRLRREIQTGPKLATPAGSGLIVSGGGS